MEYFTTKEGDVYNADGYKMNPYTQSDGYKQIKMYQDGCTRQKYVHRMVWEEFMGPIPNNMQINHINEDKTDNRLENLELVTCEENIRKRSYNKLNMEACKSIRKEYVQKSYITLQVLASRYGVHPTTIHNCITEKTWK